MDTEVQVPTKRIVLWQCQGEHAGLWHIMGTDEGFAALPEWVDGVMYPDGHQSSADYLKSNSRMHVYKERA